MSSIRDPLSKSFANRRLVIVVILLLAGFVAISAYGSSLPKQDILPSFQGETNGFYSYQPSGQNGAILNEAIPKSGCASYSWAGTATPSGIQVTKSGSLLSGCGGLFTGSGSDTIAAQTQENLITCGYSTGVLGCPDFWRPIPISYSVPNPSNSSQKEVVSGQIEAYSFNTEILINSGGSSLEGNGYFNFDGDTIWSSIISSLWDRLQSGGANCDPATASASNQCVFEASIYGVVADFVTVNNWANSNCNLCTQGAALNFYSDPSAAGQTLVSLVNSANTLSSLNSSLSSVYAPDSRLSNVAYWPITISHLQDSCNPFGCSAPQGKIYVTLYTLKLGEYLTGTTNPSGVGLGTNPTQSCSNLVCDVEGVTSWLANPFNQILASLGLGLGLLVIVVIFASPVVVALIFAFSGRKKTI